METRTVATGQSPEGLFHGGSLHPQRTAEAPAFSSGAERRPDREASIRRSSGAGTAAGAESGFALLQRACEGEVLWVCRRVAMIYRDGNGSMPPDADRARTLFERGCHAGDAPSCRWLAPLPGRPAVVAAYESSRSVVRACAPERHGRVSVSVDFSSDGRVSGVTLPTGLRGTPVGECIDRPVRTVTIPPFANDDAHTAFTYVQ